MIIYMFHVYHCIWNGTKCTMVCNFLACISFKDLTYKCEKKLASQHEQLIKDFNCENPQYCKKNLWVKGTDNSSPPELMYLAELNSYIHTHTWLLQSSLTKKKTLNATLNMISKGYSISQGVWTDSHWQSSPSLNHRPASRKVVWACHLILLRINSWQAKTNLGPN